MRSRMSDLSPKARAYALLVVALYLFGRLMYFVNGYLFLVYFVALLLALPLGLVVAAVDLAFVLVIVLTGPEAVDPDSRFPPGPLATPLLILNAAIAIWLVIRQARRRFGPQEVRTVLDPP